MADCDHRKVQGWFRQLGVALVLGLVSACGGQSAGDNGGNEETSSGSDDGTTGSPDATTMPGSDGEATAEATTGDAESEGGPSTTSSMESTGTPADCPDNGLAPGMHTGLTLMHDGVERSYDVYVPRGYTGDEPVPLVFDFHGYLGSPAGQADFSQIVPAADAAGVVIVLPAGIGNSWNAGACCGQAVSDDVDDVGFIRALVAAMGDYVCFDPARVFAMGMSNGAYISNRVGCEAADVFAAIGPVAGMIQIPLDECQPSRPISVMHFHGTADLIVPYEGGGIYNFPSVAESIAVWVDRNGCADAQPTVTYDQGAVLCETWSACDEGAEVTLCTVEGMGHCWPGNNDCPYGASNDDISATNALLGFFAAHPMP